MLARTTLEEDGVRFHYEFATLCNKDEMLDRFTL
jgi:hypothetical protein